MHTLAVVYARTTSTRLGPAFMPASTAPRNALPKNAIRVILSTRRDRRPALVLSSTKIVGDISIANVQCELTARSTFAMSPHCFRKIMLAIPFVRVPGFFVLP